MFKPYGIVPPIVTPLTADERVSEKGMRDLVEYCIKGGVTAVFVAGSTGEFYNLTRDDLREAVSIAVDQAAGRIPVYAGCTGPCTREAIARAQICEEAGADVMLAITPYYGGASQTEVYEHFMAIAKEVSLPFLVYNISPRTNIRIDTAVLAKLADEDNIVGTKDSDSNMKGFIEYCDATENKEFGVMTGSDALLLASLMAGASGGIIASAGVVPQFSAALYEKFQKGDIAGAKAEQDKITKFVGSMFSLGTFPQGAKEALRLLGVEVGNAFRPIKPFNDEQLGKLKATMKEFGLI